MIRAHIRDLYCYPIKSVRGFRVNKLELDEFGPKYDRQWMLIDESGRMLTLRQLPELARIGVQFEDGVALELSAAQAGSVDFGLEEREGDEFEVEVWKDRVPAFEVSADVSAWFSDVLSRKVRLLRLSERARRPFDERFAGRSVRFVDGAPVLVISQSSLKDLEAKCGSSLSMARFRPNLVIEGTPAFAEDRWPMFKVGRMEFKAIRPCSRCKVTTVHPLTGQLGDEPLKTLATYRKQEKGVMFGYYFAHLNQGVIEVGQNLEF